MDNVKTGDYVRHKDIKVNGGVPMQIKEMKMQGGDQLVQLEYLNPEGIFRTGWFNLSDCNAVEYGKS